MTTPSYCTQNAGNCNICPLFDGIIDCGGNIDLSVLEKPTATENPDHPSYCTQNKGDCYTCPLVNHDLDCQNHQIDDEGGGS